MAVWGPESCQTTTTTQKGRWQRSEWGGTLEVNHHLKNGGSFWKMINFTIKNGGSGTNL